MFMKHLPTLLFLDVEETNFDIITDIFYKDHLILRAKTPGEALDKLTDLQVEVAVIDEPFANSESMGFLQELTDRYPNTEKVIMGTKPSTDTLLHYMNKFHISYYVQKPLEASTLRNYVAEAVRRARRNIRCEKMLSQLKSLIVSYESGVNGIGATKDLQVGIQFTSKEQEILNYLVEGKSSKEIAKILNISKRTVENHRANMMRKAKVHSVTELLNKVFSLSSF